MGASAAVPGKRERHRAVEVLARWGLASVAVSFALVGSLALLAALHSGGAETDRQGALADIARKPWGKPVLLLIALGFAGYAAWRFVLAATGKEIETKREKKPLSRLGYAARGVLYSGLAVTTVRIMLTGSKSASGGSQRHAATILSWPGGQLIVGAIGLAFIGSGLFNGYRGITRKYEEQLKMWQIPKHRQNKVAFIARFGLLTRMVLFLIVGWFLIRTAINHDPKNAIGLDGALQKLAAQAYGRLLLAVAAVGLLAYAAYRAIEAKYRRV
ncbi:MAG: hypothetical protein NVSMB57_07720 [Actinomycetota bacterium]